MCSFKIKKNIKYIFVCYICPSLFFQHLVPRAPHFKNDVLNISDDELFYIQFHISIYAQFLCFTFLSRIVLKKLFRKSVCCENKKNCIQHIEIYIFLAIYATHIFQHLIYIYIYVIFHFFRISVCRQNEKKLH